MVYWYETEILYFQHVLGIYFPLRILMGGMDVRQYTARTPSLSAPVRPRTCSDGSVDCHPAISEEGETWKTLRFAIQTGQTAQIGLISGPYEIGSIGKLMSKLPRFRCGRRSWKPSVSFSPSASLYFHREL